MPAYQYWAMTEIGDTVSGKLTASSPDAASHLLTLRGWTVRRLEELAEDSPPASEPVVLSDEDFDTVAAQLETITQHRLPLVTSLRTLAEESPRPRLRQAVTGVMTALEQGRSLDEALVGLRSAMPKRMGVLFEDGVHTGRLPFLIQHAVEQFRRTADLRRRVAMNLMYPFILILIALGICGAVVFGLVPTFKEIFDDFGTELPGLTRLLIAFSDFGAARTMLVISGIAVLGMIVVLALSRGEGRNWWHAVLSRLPLVGSLFRAASLSGFCRMLAVLVDSGYSLTDAFRIAAAVNDDAGLAASAQHVITDLEQGISPVDAVRVSEAFPREILPVFRWADQRGLFIEALQGAADIYAARSQMNSGIVAVVLEPVAMFGVGVTMGLIVLALFMPLIKLLNDLA